MNSIEPNTQRRRFAVPLALFTILAFQVPFLSEPNRAQAQAFGDSNWVAPDASFDADSTADGPRVAPKDHEREWETVLRTPFRVVFFPLRLVARGVEAGVGHFGPRFLDPKPKKAPKLGPSLGVAVEVGTATDLRVGPAVTWLGVPTANTKLRASATWSLTDQRHIRFRESLISPRPVSLRIRADYDYKPTRRYYGIGNSSLKTNLSYYLLENTNVEAAVLLGSSPLKHVRLVGAFSSMGPRRGYNRSPLLDEVHATSTVPFANTATKEFLYGIGVDLAAIDEGRDPSRGIHGRADVRRATGIRSIDPDYSQWWVEGRAYVPVFAKHRVLAFRGVYTGVEPRGGATTSMPFYRLPQSAGSSQFAGYNSSRFRDLQLALARVEYRWPILRRLNAIALFEMGEVAPDPGSFRLRATHNSYGGGLRLGLNEEDAFRLELAQSPEGLHVVFELGSDF